MNLNENVQKELVENVYKDPYPSGHTSTYWQEYGAKNHVAFEGGKLVLQAYGIGNVIHPSPIHKFLSVVERLTYRSFISTLPMYPAIWCETKMLARQIHFGLSYDVWKFSVILSILSEHWRSFHLSPKTFAMIGDGYGFLGALIRRCLKDVRIYCIDLPKTLVFQSQTHAAADPSAKLCVLSPDQKIPAEVNFVAAPDVEVIPDNIDCAINVASMQEMNHHSISSYFNFLRKRSTSNSRFYCVNRLEKELAPGGEIAKFCEYPWQEKDEIFIDGVCPYYSHFIEPHTLSKGPRFLGMRIPFVNYFDGTHMHRLVRLAPQE